MAILPIIEAPDPRLKTISRPVDGVDDALRQLLDDMRETMYAAPGIGLAAIQVGQPLRALVIDLQEDEIKAPHYFVNPEIIRASDVRAVYSEGCLSVPEQFAEVERPAEVTVQYVDYDGTARTQALDGLMATCLQHEMDHLNGILFIDHLSRLKRDVLMRKLAKARRDTAA